MENPFFAPNKLNRRISIHSVLKQRNSAYVQQTVLRLFSHEMRSGAFFIIIAFSFLFILQ